METLPEGLGGRWRASGAAGNAAGADKTDPKTFAMADDPEVPEMIMRDSIRKMPYLQRNCGLSTLEMWAVKRLLQVVATALAATALKAVDVAIAVNTARRIEMGLAFFMFSPRWQSSNEKDIPFCR